MQRIKLNKIDQPSCNYNLACRVPTNKFSITNNSSLIWLTNNFRISLLHLHNPCTSTCLNNLICHPSNSLNHHHNSSIRRLNSHISTLQNLRDLATIRQGTTVATSSKLPTAIIPTSMTLHTITTPLRSRNLNLGNDRCLPRRSHLQDLKLADHSRHIITPHRLEDF